MDGEFNGREQSIKNLSFFLESANVHSPCCPLQKALGFWPQPLLQWEFADGYGDVAQGGGIPLFPAPPNIIYDIEERKCRRKEDSKA